MKIATFNINNVNKRLQQLLAWLQECRPDVACLQELKAEDAKFPEAEIEKAGYCSVWQGQRSWNGVAILSCKGKPVVTQNALPGDPADSQSRYLEAAVDGVLIGTLYAPNGNPQPGPKFKYKLAWMERFIAHAAALYELDAPVVLAGDYNIVPTPADIYPSTSYAKNALVQPESRAAFQRLLDQGWIDAIRKLHPDTPMYTFWDYMRNRWPRDAGLRIDHLLLNPKAAKRLTDAGVDREVRGKDGASDHAPAWIVLRETGGRRRVSGTPRKPAPKSPRATAAKPAKRAKATKTSKTTASAKAARRPLLVIDGDSFAHRSYHALPKNILGPDKEQTGAILGFANLLLRLYREEQPRAVLVAWDTLEAPTYRHEQFPSYQSGREFDDALVGQLQRLPRFVTACGFQNAKAAGYEADDFLAAAAKAEERRGGTVLVASGDRDSFQLASDRTTILYPLRAGEMARIDPAAVRARYGVDPKQVPDFIALRGDPSDKLPGAAGVGATGAATLLTRYGTLEAALKAGRFPAQADALRLYRSIAAMNQKAPLPPLRNQKPTFAKAAVFAREWGLKKLGARLDELATETSHDLKRRA
jgi:exodeoxyribonuclease-3